MAHPDMREVLLGQYQRQYDADCDQGEKLEAAEEQARKIAYRETWDATMATLAAGGPAASELMAEHDMPLMTGTAWDTIAEALKRNAEGNQQAAIEHLTAYAQSVAHSVATDAGLAAMADVARQAMREAA